MDGAASNAGSSPRLWGTQSTSGCWRARYRFIPTPVGNSKKPIPSRTQIPVHPHACGELDRCGSLDIVYVGSSPRLWGTHFGWHFNLLKHRFIPTPVGNSLWNPVACGLCSVHPHACGELETYQLVLLDACGSSPRLWGTRFPARMIPCQHRFIPTPVGNS